MTQQSAHGQTTPPFSPALNQYGSTLWPLILSRADQATLSACLRVCKPWYRIALPQLYRHVSIDGRGAYEKAFLLMQRTPQWSSSRYPGLGSDDQGLLPLRPDGPTESLTIPEKIYRRLRTSYTMPRPFGPLGRTPRLNILASKQVCGFEPPGQRATTVVLYPAQGIGSPVEDTFSVLLAWAEVIHTGCLVLSISLQRSSYEVGKALAINTKAPGFTIHIFIICETEMSGLSRIDVLAKALGDWRHLCERLHCHLVGPGASDLHKIRELRCDLETALSSRSKTTQTPVYLHVSDDDVPPPAYISRAEWRRMRRHGIVAGAASKLEALVTED